MPAQLQFSADEVRKLAERSSRETKQIVELIKRVQDGTRQAVAAMEAGHRKVEHGSRRAVEAGEALDQIRRAVESTLERVSEITRSVERMTGAGRGLSVTMESISAVVEQNSAATHQMSGQAEQLSNSMLMMAIVADEQCSATEAVSSSTEEMSAQIETMSTRSRELARAAEALNALVTSFMLEDDQCADVVVPLRRAAWPGGTMGRMSAQEIDAYLAELEEPKRSTLQTLRETIQAIVPEAEQCISYGMPAFRMHGKVIAGFAAFTHHLAYLPHSGSVFQELRDELAGYESTSGSLHFPIDRPLPEALVRKLIDVRLRQVRQSARDT